MNGFDVAMAMLLLVAVLLGLTAGLVRICLGIVSLASATVVALGVARPVGERLEPWVGSPELSLLLGFTVAFALVLLAFSLLAWLLRRGVEGLGLSWADRALGAVASTLVVLAAACLVSLALARAVPEARLTRESRLLPRLATVAEAGLAALPEPWRGHGERTLGQLAAWARGRAQPGAPPPPSAPAARTSPTPRRSPPRSTARPAHGGGAG